MYTRQLSSAARFRCQPWFIRPRFAGCGRIFFTPDAPGEAVQLQNDAKQRHKVRAFFRTGNQQTQQHITSTPPSNEQLATTRVFYLPHCIDPKDIPRTVTDIPLVAAHGDAYMLHQNMDFSYDSATDPTSPLISPAERRRARKKALASTITIHSTGGYRTKMEMLQGGPQSGVIAITAVCAAFNVPYLEADDFIVAMGAPAVPNPMFPHYYPDTGGAILSHQEALDRGGAALLPDGRILDLDAYFWSLVEDLTLSLTAFDSMVANQETQKKGLFKATALGLDNFATIHGTTINISKELGAILVEAYEHVLTHNTFPNIAKIEFPCHGHGHYRPAPTGLDTIQLQSSTRDVLEFTPEERESFTCGVLIPSNGFSMPGNDYSYVDVESMIGNNTDLRFVQSYIYNAYLLDRERYIPVTIKP